MQQYVGGFDDSGFDDLDIVADMTESDINDAVRFAGAPAYPRMSVKICSGADCAGCGEGRACEEAGQEHTGQCGCNAAVLSQPGNIILWVQYYCLYCMGVSPAADWRR